MKNGLKNVSTSFRVLSAPESWSKYTTKRKIWWWFGGLISKDTTKWSISKWILEELMLSMFQGFSNFALLTFSYENPVCKKFAAKFCKKHVFLSLHQNAGRLFYRAKVPSCSKRKLGCVKNWISNEIVNYIILTLSSMFFRENQSVNKYHVVSYQS